MCGAEPKMQGINGAQMKDGSWVLRSTEVYIRNEHTELPSGINLALQ